MGAFVDAALIKQFKDTYLNWQGLTRAGNNYAVYAAGLDAKYRFKKKVEISGTLAVPLKDNPLFNSSGNELNVDNRNRDVQLWLKSSYLF